MVIIKFSVKGQNLILRTDLTKMKVTSDTINYFKCKFEFDESWDGFDKRVYFKNASFNITKPAIPDASGYCFIPWEVLAHTGVILCNVTGARYSGTDLAERITAGPVRMFVHNPGSEEQLIKRIKDKEATVDPLNVFHQKEEGTLEPDYQMTLTPSEYEQYVGQIKEFFKYAQSNWIETDETKLSFILHKPNIPGKVSELLNDIGYITEAGIEKLTNEDIEELCS